jgi:Dihydrofolate reductase
MRKIILYIAMSIDGYIADTNGGVSWLNGDGSDVTNEGSYGEFISTIDTVILGYKTYHQLITELSPDTWVYPDKMSYVITHKKLEDKENILFTDDLLSLIAKLKEQDGKDIWICGGASIVNQLIGLNMIDRFYITLIPSILGSGIRLFETFEKEILLKLISTRCYNGMTDLVYEPRL